MNYKRVTVNVTNRTIVRTILWIIATILLYKFLSGITQIISIIVASFFLALALNPVVTWIAKKLRLKSRVKATAISYLLVIVILAFFFFLIIPPLINQTRTFVSNFPQTVQNFQSQNSPLARAARKYHIDRKLTDAAKKFASHYSNYGSSILDAGKRIVEVVASVLAVLVLTFMMLVEGHRWVDLFLGIVPSDRRSHHRAIAHKMYLGVTGYVRGQVILAVTAGVFALIALEIVSHILNVNVNPLALAGIVAVFGLIPLFGNPAAAIIVVAVSLINSLTMGIIMAAYFVIYFFIENHTFQPYIQSRLNNLTPLTVFIAALIGVGFYGLLGAIVAIPVASAIKILVEDYFERKRHKEAPTHHAANAAS